MTATKRSGARSRPFDAEDVVLLFFALTGLLGGMALSLWTAAKPIVVATFLGVGIATLVYRFLGGISATDTVTIGVFKIGGSLGALLASAVIINTALERQAPPIASVRSAQDLVGRWKSQWAPGGLITDLYFTQGPDGGVRFKGGIARHTEGSATPVFAISGGVATLRDDNRLELSANVKDLVYGGREFKLITAVPLDPLPGFFGRLLVPDGPREGQVWGVALMREP